MEELVDFEELIDLKICLDSMGKNNEIFSQKSSQDPISDMLDKMCEVLGENNLAMNNISKGETRENMPENTVFDLNEFEHVLASTYLYNKCIDVHDTHSIADDNNKTEGKDIFNVLPYEVPVEFEETAPLVTGCVSSDKDEKLAEFVSCTLGHEKNTAPAGNTTEFKNVNDLENIKLEVNFRDMVKMVDDEVENIHLETSEFDISVDEDIINLNEFISEDEEIKETIVTETAVNTENKSMEDSNNIDNADIINLDSDGNYSSSDFKFISKDEAKEGIFTESNNFAITNKPMQISNNINNRDITNLDDDDDGYNSLDFEFITEAEASKEVLVTKSNITREIAKSIPNNFNNMAKDTRTPTFKPYGGKRTSNYKNEASLSDYIKYSKHRYHRCYVWTCSAHVIPEGEQYLDMFRGQFAPAVINNLHISRNKSVLPTTAMAAKFEDLGFSIPESSDEEYAEYKDDAEDCAKKILSMYPGENRRKRRRF